MPGYSQNTTDYLARRKAQSHAAFLLPHLRPGLRLLDCGCGSGSITCDLALIVAPGTVVGLDRELSQVERARSDAASQGLDNVVFEQGNVYEIPFPDESFDVAFAHAVFQHLAAPDRALAEIKTLLRQAGFTTLCFSASYECYESAGLFGQSLAERLEAEGSHVAATILRNWSTHEDALFAQAWCEIVGTRNTA